MSFTEQLRRADAANDSLLCVGLDPDPSKFPGAWKGDASRIFDFCAAIVDATHDLVIAFKPQIAYFAAQRAEDQLERVIAQWVVISPDQETAREYGRVRSRLREMADATQARRNDLWIAALCIQHDLPLLTNDRGFDVIHGLTVVRG